MAGCDCEVELKDGEQRRILVALLAINGFMFIIEIVLGIMSESTALIADSLDMLADALVYAIALYAVGRSDRIKAQAAYGSGLFQITLGAVVLFDIVRRLIFGSEPVSTLMMVVGSVALVANMICLALISKQREGEVHMRASWIFSKNDVIANVGIIVGGALVMLTGTRFPDIIIGLAIAAIVMRGGFRIIANAKGELAATA